MGRKKLLTHDQVLNAINLWIRSHGIAPTIEELRNQLKVASTRTVMRYLDDLETADKIERWAGARGLRPLRASGAKGLHTREVPIVGEVSAGPLNVADEYIEGWVRLPKEYVRSDKSMYFLLRVRGDSMNKAEVDGGKIESGDLVLVRQDCTAHHGEIVVSLVDGETNIKRLIEGPGYYVLQPESTRLGHKPIVLTREFEIQGVVVRVLKRGSNLLTLEN